MEELKYFKAWIINFILGIIVALIAGVIIGAIIGFVLGIARIDRNTVMKMTGLTEDDLAQIRH